MIEENEKNTQFSKETLNSEIDSSTFRKKLGEKYDLSHVHSVPEKWAKLKPGQEVSLEDEEIKGHVASLFKGSLISTDFYSDHLLMEGTWRFEGIQETLSPIWRSLDGERVRGDKIEVAVFKISHGNSRVAKVVFLVED